MHRDGYQPVFCRMIPVELHGQKAYARNLNVERADLELLNDGSELLIDGYKVEGPGTLVRTENGGKTQINLFNAAWWGNKNTENVLFEVADSEMSVCGGHVFCYPQDEKYCGALAVSKDGGTEFKGLKECSGLIEGKPALGRDLGRCVQMLRIVK